jgi:hypothetical protein
MGQTNTGASPIKTGESHGGQKQGTAAENRMTTGSSQHQEGPLARAIEQQTAKLPSDTFLWAALGSIGASAVLRMIGKKNASLFVGDWVAPMLLFGVYNKIVKLQGSDRFDQGH